MNNNRFPGVKAEVFSILNLLNNCSQQSTIILFSLGPLSNTAVKRFVLHLNLSTYLARVLSDPQIPYQVSNSEQKPSNTNKENSYFHFKSRLPFSLGCQPTVYDFWQQLLLGRSNCKVIKTKNCNIAPHCRVFTSPSPHRAGRGTSSVVDPLPPSKRLEKNSEYEEEQKTKRKS